jgi:thiol-disulfide isomerase/thioredoxin
MPLPQVYLARNRRDAWMLLAMTDPEMRASQVASANLLKLRRQPDGDFAFWIGTDQPQPLYFGFSHPDVLKFWESPPIFASALTGGTWDVILPEPTTLEVALQSPPDSAGLSPFGKGFYSLTPVIAGQADAVPLLESGSLEAPNWRGKLGKLAPGAYNLNIQTLPRDDPNPPQDLLARAGRFYDRRTIELKPGVPNLVTFDAPRFDPDAWKGTRSAVVVIQPAGERPVEGEDYRVSFVLANYGTVPVASGKLGTDGKIVLERIAASGSNPLGGDYWVEVAGESLGKFRVEDRAEPQEFALRMPFRAGDRISGLALDLETGRSIPLAEFRGRVVFLEFWATWCGPCREPMERLVALDKKRGEAGRKDLALVAVGIDNDRAVLQRQSRHYGAPGVRFLWSPADGSDPGADAHARFSIFAVPTAFLIGKDGKIAWRGHPLSIDVEKKIDELLAEGR